MFGIVPAALMGVDVERFLEVAAEMAVACQAEDGNPGLELGLRLGEGWQKGRDKVCVDATPTGFGLWAEQLLAESTGKHGKGLVPAPGEPPDGPDRQRGEIDSSTRTTSAGELYRWEFATAVAGHVLGINPFDQPDVQAAKDKTSEVLAGGDADARSGRVGGRAARRRRRPGDYVASRPSSTRPARRSWRRSSRARTRPAASSRTASARATCTRPASCTRAARTPASSSRSSTRPARAADPRPRLRLRPADPRAGGRRLGCARGAGPPRDPTETGGV